MKWKVRTLTDISLGQACRELELAVASAGFRPDAVLSIATGGVYVGERMFADVPHFSVGCRRPSTSHKGAGLRKVLRHLPRPVQNALRICEAIWLGRKKAGGEDIGSKPQPAVPGMGAPRSILIVDDAVDSGRTLERVVRAARAAYPDSDIRSAAITVTTDAPLRSPHYAIFRDHTLIRFPWSADA